MFAHQVIFALTHGYWPTSLIDHRDGNPDNTDPDNLREATHATNSRNVVGKGCYRVGNRWRAKIVVDGKYVSLGYYATQEEACGAYIQAKKKYHPECERV